MNDGKTRILLADDHAVLRAGLRLLLDNQPDFAVVAEAGDGLEAVAQAQIAQPEVILLDLTMPRADGLSILPKLREVSPASRILILTMHDDASYLKQALAAGASGYVLKQAVDTELIIAIRAILRGELYVHSAMTAKLLASPHAPAEEANDPWKALSEREYGVLTRVALGFTNAEIAEAMYLSEKTVETYRARGMEKLGVGSRAQLVKLALRWGHLEG